MKKLFLFFWILLGIVTTSVYSQEKIQFGAALSLTGKLAKEGNLVKNGYELWKEVVNKKGGINIGGKKYLVEIIYYDDESDPNRAAKLIEKLITEDKVKLILGPYGSDSVFSTSAITEKYGALMVQGYKVEQRLINFIQGVLKTYLEFTLWQVNIWQILYLI